ncbi:hypothetical protein OW763_01090 [Clostridium aestuarii]|uniref:Uncharacterized protein n=1 Tax=Clostridium aestuarii TaxID=338193 RepID=A0ABT4CYC7_9CLOT|nr:hypothetical protein [Clostridium aestuarii]MCY6482950.1 hypothetical protein [Clostridium aestuarii]
MNQRYDSNKIFIRYMPGFHEYMFQDMFYSPWMNFNEKKFQKRIDKSRQKYDLSKIDFNYLYDYLYKEYPETIKYLGGNKTEFLKLFDKAVKYIPKQNQKSMLYIRELAEWNYNNILLVKKTKLK